MPWPLRLVDIEEIRQRAKAEGKYLNDYLRPGDYWFAPWMAEHPWMTSPEYKRDWQGKRLPIVVQLPDGLDWSIDGEANNMGGHGWTITGEPPQLTASPSIGTSRYHGWLQNGVLSDDIEGRHYPPTKETHEHQGTTPETQG